MIGTSPGPQPATSIPQLATSVSELWHGKFTIRGWGAPFVGSRTLDIGGVAVGLLAFVTAGCFDAYEPAPIADAGPAVVPVDHCPVGGPEGSSTLLLGPPAGGQDDLWRGLEVGEGEGASFTIPRAGVIRNVVVQISAFADATGVLTRLYRWCERERVLAVSIETPASAFPAYVDTDPSTAYWEFDLRMTTIAIDPPLPVAEGERVDTVFSAASGSLVEVITEDDIVDGTRAIFPNGGPGLGNGDAANWEYHAQIDLR